LPQFFFFAANQYFTRHRYWNIHFLSFPV